MAVFYNQATLYYNNTVTNSNVVTGEIVEVLSADKYAVSASYTQNEILSYVISVVNSGNMPYSDISPKVCWKKSFRPRWRIFISCMSWNAAVTIGYR